MTTGIKAGIGSSNFTLSPRLPVKSKMYKLLIVVALAVACMAEPEANAEAYRGGYGSPYGGHGGYRSGHGGYRGGYGGAYRRGGYGYRHKRSAEAEAEAVAAPEAEAEADPAYLYGGAYNVAPYATTYGVAPIAYTSAPYSAYNGYGYGYGLTAPAAYYGGAHFIGKREAEAEPGYAYGGYGRAYGGYGGHGGYGRSYGYGYAPRAYGYARYGYGH
ncbi:prisilkin-39-like [Tigriopus californicus]|uniref:prisilkin-39-like n=1 Tax=Tigriopus californicus TaxID=6832 RepID=UPI0027DA1A67|nr:prisilkin-39-like [Tigriopus californicus]